MRGRRSRLAARGRLAADRCEIIESDGDPHAGSTEGSWSSACGGGGIPVDQDEAGELAGVEAVIDKDLASAPAGARDRRRRWS